MDDVVFQGFPVLLYSRCPTLLQDLQRPMFCSMFCSLHFIWTHLRTNTMLVVSWLTLKLLWLSRRCFSAIGDLYQFVQYDSCQHFPSDWEQCYPTIVRTIRFLAFILVYGDNPSIFEILRNFALLPEANKLFTETGVQGWTSMTMFPDTRWDAIDSRSFATLQFLYGIQRLQNWCIVQFSVYRLFMDVIDCSIMNYTTRIKESVDMFRSTV